MEEKKTISIEEYNKELEESDLEIKEGLSYTHDEVIKISENWIDAK